MGSGGTIYGDGIYNNTDVIRRKKRGLGVTQQDLREISNLNGGRTSVENLFGDVVKDWQFIDFKRNKKVLSCPCGVGNLYKVAMLLNNFRTCCRGSQSGGGIFGLSPPSLGDYIAGVVGDSPSVVPNITMI